MTTRAKKTGHFNIFKTFTLKWWQGGIFKWSVFLLGIAVGAYWHEIFAIYVYLFTALAVVGLAYITCVWWRQ